MVNTTINNTVFTIFSKPKQRIGVLGCHNARLNILFIFLKNPGFTLKQPCNLLLWLIVDHMPWRKSKPGFRTFTPACQSASWLPKCQTMCILFLTKSMGYQHSKICQTIQPWIECELLLVQSCSETSDIYGRLPNGSWTTIPSKSLDSIPVLT